MKLNKIYIYIASYIAILGLFAVSGYLIVATVADQNTPQKMVADDHNGRRLVFVNLPPVSVNMPSSDSAHAGNVRMEIAMEVQNRFADRVTSLEPRITDHVVGYTQSLNFNRLLQPRATNWLKPNLLQVINAATAPTPVSDVVFKKFTVL